MTDRRVIVGSFHSCSYYALDTLDHDLIFSFDSHFDTNTTGADDEICKAMGNDVAIKYAAGRAATHSMFRKKFPSARMLIVTPAAGLETQAAYVRNNVRERIHSNTPYHNLDSDDMFGNHVGSKSELIGRYLRLLKLMQKIDVFTAPPKDPVELSDMIKGAANPLLDIDVDYFAELQSECYTPLLGAEPHQLGNIERVLRLIRSTKPDTITLSEATVAALNDPNSRTSYLLNRLKTMGYSVQKFFLYGNDMQARESIKRWNDFGIKVRETVTAKYWSNGPPNLESTRQMASDIAEYAKRYFSSENQTDGSQC